MNEHVWRMGLQRQVTDALLKNGRHLEQDRKDARVEPAGRSVGRVGGFHSPDDPKDSLSILRNGDPGESYLFWVYEDINGDYHSGSELAGDIDRDRVSDPTVDQKMSVDPNRCE